jgi:predicted DNA-binding WGR domain protein
MTTRLEFVEGNSAKFWQIVISGSSTTVSYGKIGTSGQQQEKDHGSAAAAAKFAAKMIAEKEKKGYKRGSSANDYTGDDDEAEAETKQKQKRTKTTNDSDDGSITVERLGQLREQLEALESKLEDQSPEDTWQEMTADPLVLALACAGAEEVLCLCPVTRLSEAKQSCFPWTWKATLPEFIESTWASMPDAAPLIAQLQQDVREIVALETKEKGWRLVYVMRAAKKKLRDGLHVRFEEFRTNLSFAVGSNPAKQLIPWAKRRLMKNSGWAIDPQLLAMWAIHGEIEPCSAAHWSEWYIGTSDPTVPPQKFRLQADIYDAGDDERLGFDAKEFAELIQDTGGVCCAMYRISKVTNEQAVVSWDHETPGQSAEGVQSSVGRTIVDFLRVTVFSGAEDDGDE